MLRSKSYFLLTVLILDLRSNPGVTRRRREIDKMNSKIVITYPLPGDPKRFLSDSYPSDVWINPVEEILSRNTLIKLLPGVEGLVVTPGDGPINDEIFLA